MTVEMLDRPARYREVWAEPIFRTLFLGRSLATMATTLRIVALSVLVFAATGSTLLSAITFGIGFLPQVIGGAVLGALPDRLPARPVLTFGFLLECASALVLALAGWSVGANLALVAAVAVVSPVFSGSASRLIAGSLTGDAYVLGRSMFTIAGGMAQLVGMAFGGVAIALLGPRHALLVSAAAHLISAAIVRFGLPAEHSAAGRGRLIRGAGRPAEGGSANEPSAGTNAASSDAASGRQGAVKESWKVNGQLLRNAGIRRLLVIQWLPPTLAVGAEGLIVAYAQQRELPQSAAGMMLAAVPGGMLVGDLIVGRFVRPSVRVRLVAPLIGLLGLPLLGLVADPGLPVLIALLALAGAGFAFSLGLQQSFLDAVPEENRGQAFGLLTTGLMTWQGVGPLIFGVLGQLTGAKWAIVASGVASVLVAAGWAAAQNRRHGSAARLPRQPAR